MSTRLYDLRDQRFERLAVLNSAHSPSGVPGWWCRCDCGEEMFVKTAALVGGNTRSCGCLHKDGLKERGSARRRDLTGQKFNRLTVLGTAQFTRPDGRTERRWKCRCDCGTEIVAEGSSLWREHNKSCGCLNMELRIDRAIRKARRYRLSLGKPADVPIRPRSHLLRSLFVRTGQAVKRRDRYSCALCGGGGGRLHTHHIEPWATAESLRFDLNNLITLCRDCHIDKAHRGDIRASPDPTVATILKGIVRERMRVAA